MVRDFQNELRTAQADVKTLGSKREKMSGDARVEQEKVNQSVAELVKLGHEDAAALSVDDLRKLRDKAQADLETNLDKLQEGIKAANTVVAEYEAVGA